jgi:hypothetical protein
MCHELPLESVPDERHHSYAACRSLSLWVRLHRPKQVHEKPFCGNLISLGLQIYVNHFAILIDCSAKTMLFAVDLALKIYLIA